MSGTDILHANRMDTRLLQTYRALNYYPEGVDPEQHGVISPPCAGLQDLAWQIRIENPRAPVLKIPEQYMIVHSEAA
eukprot:12015792-Prorocentrum_lima.AAC.1